MTKTSLDIIKESKSYKLDIHSEAIVLPLNMANLSELYISSGSKLVWNLCLRRRDQTARVRWESLNVSLRSV